MWHLKGDEIKASLTTVAKYLRVSLTQEMKDLNWKQRDRQASRDDINK